MKPQVLPVLPLEISKDLKRNWQYLLIVISSFVFSNTLIYHIQVYSIFLFGFFVGFFFVMESELRL